MSRAIPLRRTGLLIFSIRVASILTGMVFLIFITGWLKPARFGLWEVITGFVALASYPAGWLGFWATRVIARGRLIGRTVIVLNLALSMAGVGIYLLLSFPAAASLGSSYGPFLLALLLVPMAYWNQAANSVAGGYRPSALGVSVLFAELSKLLVAYVALFMLRLEIYGVIGAIMASYLVQSAVTTTLVRGASTEPVDLSAGRAWLSDSWIPAVYSLPGTIFVADTVVASLATGGYTVAGYYQAAFSIGSLVSYAGFLSYALYPLLLRGGSEDLANATLDFILMFGTPMAVGAIVLAPKLLAMLSPAYLAQGADVSLALAILAVSGLVAALSAFVDSTLIGRERSDIEGKRDFRAYLRSDFIFVSFVNLAFIAGYIVAVFVETRLGSSEGLGISAMVGLWAAFQLVMGAASMAVKLRRLRGRLEILFPRTLLTYFACALAMAAVLYVGSGSLSAQGTDRFVYALRVASVVGLGAGFYFGLLLLVSRSVRSRVFAFLGALRPRGAAAPA